MPKGAKKQTRKARQSKGGRPRKEGVDRYEGGQIRHEHRGRDEPSAMALRQIAAHGPSDAIDRAVSEKIITQAHGDAFDRYRRDRAAKLELRDVEAKPGPLARIMVRDPSDAQELPSSWRAPMSDKERERRAERYDAAYSALKATGDRQAVGQAALVCGGYQWSVPASLRTAGEALRKFYLDGVKKVA